MNEGRKNDVDKLRLDLIPTTTIEALGNVLTFGAKKYDDRNWEKGLKWSRIIGAMKRHLIAFQKGEDIDPESGLLHTEHLLANASFLHHFINTYPEGDDRAIMPVKQRRLGLDLDGVIFDFAKGLMDNGLLNKVPQHWNDVSYKDWIPFIDEHGDDFWRSLSVIDINRHMPVEPKVYITKRYKCSRNAIIDSLYNNDLPIAPVVILGYHDSKVDAAKQYNLDVFVDDNYDNYVELNSAGIVCYLMDALHNRKHNVGYKRISSIMDLSNKYKIF